MEQRGVGRSRDERIRRVVVAGAVLRAELRLQVPPRLGHARFSLLPIDTLLAVVRQRRRVVVARDREHAAVALRGARRVELQLVVADVAVLVLPLRRVRLAARAVLELVAPREPPVRRLGREPLLEAVARAILGSRLAEQVGVPPQLVRLHRRLLGTRRRRQHGEQRAPRGAAHGRTIDGRRRCRPGSRARLMVHAGTAHSALRVTASRWR